MNNKLLLAEVIHKPNYSFVRNEIFECLEKRGHYTFKNFLSAEQVNELREKAKVILENKSEFISLESNGSDTRIYGIDKLESRFSELMCNSKIKDCINKFYFSLKPIQTFVLYGLIKPIGSNLGSGSGWHRDSVFTNQLKLIIYLSDVNEKNGPFQFVEGSHKSASVRGVSKLLNKDISEDRFSGEEINKLVNSNMKVIEFTGNKGDAILVNTRGLHTGKPLQEVGREAITLYIYNRGLPKTINQLPLFKNE